MIAVTVSSFLFFIIFIFLCKPISKLIYLIVLFFLSIMFYAICISLTVIILENVKCTLYFTLGRQL